MRKAINIVLSATLGFALLTGCATPNENVVIATAANVQFVMQELQKTFEKDTGIKTELIVGSSGKLTAQIREGAPFDLFVSADTRYPQELFENGGTEGPPKIYAKGALVLWSRDSTVAPELSQLTTSAVRKIALANPRTAPYGEAAVQVLQKAGLYESVNSKLVYGESIAQTSQYVSTGAADMGFTALSMVLSPSLKNAGRWTLLDTTSYAPIEQAAVLLLHSESSPKRQPSQQFYDFLFSEKARAIFEKYGYTVR
ncbi:molybdate ABC transporter substrate-binding protein [Arundinibacter roseus]|uniref:Molybdate ABC transporter substrate-binding protein n=1 Tax=Arundinibacter roseus TaxID=2070510 RepID=A0A4R4K115_9BACT|nr:molybdate ABC transporter substrate-binding protein [Arundinibacter roseus]TDB60011.1 molybdate ABC transporter substrate-binding protein [Arundinibacter roseus]